MHFANILILLNCLDDSYVVNLNVTVVFNNDIG